MGKNKKGYNWKAREVVNTVIDNRETKNISVSLEVPENKYDECNELVLPSKKRKTTKKKEKLKTVKLLSKKQRKRLEKIVDKGKKKENRAYLLEELQKVQATPEFQSQLTSFASVQTKGLKRIFNPSKEKKSKPVIDSNNEEFHDLAYVNTENKNLNQEAVLVKDPNIVGFEEDSSEISDEETGNESKPKRLKQDDEKINNNEVETAIKNSHSDETNGQLHKEKEIINLDPEHSADQKCEEGRKRKKNSVNNVKIEKKPAVFVDVIRDPEIQEARLKLPILGEEQQIMEMINQNAVVIVSGETGSGKTTQVPQFLYEAGYALNKQIVVTEPRRIAAISMSQRVAQEMNLSSTEVSYLVRFKGNVTDNTKIKFVTDGVLLKEIQTDFLLKKYSVVILDEAHERSLYTDILIGLLSRIVPLRIKRGDPFKLIVMSATLRVEDFTNNQRLFKSPPPVFNVDTRQFSVTVHFNKRTNDDYLKEAFNKAVKIHTSLPEGGILIFLTGQQEVNVLVKKLRKKFPLEKAKSKKIKVSKQPSANKIKGKNSGKLVKLPAINLDDYSLPGDMLLNSDEDLSDDELDENFIEDDNKVHYDEPLWVLPLYSMLPIQEQSKIFQQVPEGCRLCVVSTNVAETSLTIPGIKYVVDSGKTKVKLYDKLTGVTSYAVTWTSKAAANQRAGRAGRIGPGHCYRLYSSAVFNDTFTDFGDPEIKRKPADDLYLQMKSMGIDKVVNFPFPTAPELLQLKTAQNRLQILGALKNDKITDLGKVIAKFPVLPRFGKMLALSHQFDLLPYTICLVAALSVQEVLLEVPIIPGNPEEVKNTIDKWTSRRLKWAGIGHSLLMGDNMVLLKAMGAAEYANFQGKLDSFCQDNGLRQKAVIEIRKLRHQLTNEITANYPELDLVVDPKLEPPSDVQAKLLRQLLLSGLGDQIAKKMKPEEVPSGESKAKYKYAYYANNMEDLVFLHRGSVLRKTLPEWIVYQELYETNKIYVRGVTAIEPEWLPTYVPHLCNLSEPLIDPPPYYDEKTGKIMCTVTGTIGTQAWPLPQVEIEYQNGVDRYKWFAKFLLEGVILEKLKKYTKSLLSQPSITTKTWAKLQPRTESLLKALINKGVSNIASLKECFNDDKNYLLEEYLLWLPQSAHAEVIALWPPI